MASRRRRRKAQFPLDGCPSRERLGAEPRHRARPAAIRPPNREPQQTREFVRPSGIAPEPEPHPQAVPPGHPNHGHMEVAVDPAKRDLPA